MDNFRSVTREGISVELCMFTKSSYEAERNLRKESEPEEKVVLTLLLTEVKDIPKPRFHRGFGHLVGRQCLVR
jgi:hypothetical protein